MLDITFKVHTNNILRLVITYQSERRENRMASAKYFYDSPSLKIVSAACPDVEGSIVYLQGTSTSSDGNILRFYNLDIYRRFFTALRTCTDNLRVEL